MDISPLQNNRVDVANIPLERLAGNKQVPQGQKIEAASQAFEALLLRQILQETQRPVFPSKFVGNSTIDGIYRDLVVNQMADNISKSGTLGLGKSLSTQLQHQTSASASPAAGGGVGAQAQARHTAPGTRPGVATNTKYHDPTVTQLH